MDFCDFWPIFTTVTPPPKDGTTGSLKNGWEVWPLTRLLKYTIGIFLPASRRPRRPGGPGPGASPGLAQVEREMVLARHELPHQGYL